LVIVCFCQLILSSLFIRTNEVSIFLMADLGKSPSGCDPAFILTEEKLRARIQ
jgi:hypothetical protein